MKKIKFRAWDKEEKVMIDADSWYFSEEFEPFIDSVEKCLRRFVLMQFTGLLDKNGTEIYEGDVVRIRTAERDEQTHYGENIPRPDGKYTEPLEAVVKEVIAPVIFRDGMFTIEHIPIEDSGYWPLSVWISAWAHYETTQDMVRAFEGGWNIPVRWDDEEEGDLQYLLSEYKLKSEAELLAYLGVEVIGNIHQNKGLLKTETPPN